MAAKGAQALKEFFMKIKGFDARIFEKLNMVSCGDGKAVAELYVEQEHANPMGTLHGGLSATLVDSISSMALLTHDKIDGVHSVSVDIHLTYFKGAKVGETVEIIADTVKAGKKMAFLEVVIKNKETQEILVKGLHSKFLLPP